MKTHLVEQALEVITDPQVLVNAVSRRVRQLNTGRPALIPPVPGERYGAADFALAEIIAGKVVLNEDSEG